MFDSFGGFLSPFGFGGGAIELSGNTDWSRVKLPKSFLAVNVSDSHADDTSSSAAASTTSAASTASLED